MDTAASHAGVSDGKRDDPDEMSGNAACGDGVPSDDWRSNYGRQGVSADAPSSPALRGSSRFRGSVAQPMCHSGSTRRT